jgi:hypothetical protein
MLKPELDVANLKKLVRVHRYADADPKCPSLTACKTSSPEGRSPFVAPRGVPFLMSLGFHF